MVLLGNYDVVEDPLSTDTLQLEGGTVTVRDFLGFGRYGAVVAGRDVRTNSYIALKVMRKTDIQSTHLDVQREIDIQRGLDHPNIVRLLDVFADQVNIYLVLELAQGGDLWGRVAQGAFDEPTARTFFNQLIDVVGYMHQRAIAHRDIKLENLLLDASDQIKICDFGLSCVIQPPPNHLMLLTSGSKHYVAPEVWRALHGAGYRGEPSDIWSCGVVLFAMLCGCYPFEIETTLADTVAYQYLCKHGEYPFPSDITISPTVKRLFNRIFNPNPATRATVEDIKDEPWCKGQYTFPPISPIIIKKSAIETTVLTDEVPSVDMSDELIGGELSGVDEYRALSAEMISNKNAYTKPSFIHVPDFAVPSDGIIDTDVPMFRALKEALPHDMTVMPENLDDRKAVEALPPFRTAITRCTAFIGEAGSTMMDSIRSLFDQLSDKYHITHVTEGEHRMTAQCGTAEEFDPEARGHVKLEAAMYRFGDTARPIVEFRRKAGDIMHFQKLFREIRDKMEKCVDYPPISPI